MDSTRIYTRWVLGSTSSKMGEHEAPIVELRRVIAENGGWHRAAVALLGLAYHRAGRTAEAEAVRRDLERARGEGRDVSPYEHATLLAAHGRYHEAFARLDDALETTPSLLGTIGIAVEMDPLRADPRYAELLHRVGLTPTAR